MKHDGAGLSANDANRYCGQRDDDGSHEPRIREREGLLEQSGEGRHGKRYAGDDCLHGL